MKNLRRWVAAPVLTLGISALVGCLIWRPIGDITLVEATGIPQGHSEAAEQNTRVEVTAYVTGWVEAPADILIDQSNPNTPDSLREAQWVPSLAYAVRHPEFGIVILDTGLRAGSCDYGLRPVYWVPCRNAPGSDLVSQLEDEDVRPEDIRFIVPSHFHGDHISGLSSLLDFADATILSTSGSMSEVRSTMRFAKGIPAAMIASDMRVKIMDDSFTQSTMSVEVYDVFGDGSLKLFETPGHTKGHISAIARGTQHDILFTFDASHLEANFELGIPSGSVSSREDGLRALRNLYLSLDDPLIIYGHEPSQWQCIQSSVRLDIDAPFCE